MHVMSSATQLEDHAIQTRVPFHRSVYKQTRRNGNFTIMSERKCVLLHCCNTWCLSKRRSKSAHGGIRKQRELLRSCLASKVCGTNFFRTGTVHSFITHLFCCPGCSRLVCCAYCLSSSQFTHILEIEQTEWQSCLRAENLHVASTWYLSKRRSKSVLGGIKPNQLLRNEDSC